MGFKYDKNIKTDRKTTIELGKLAMKIKIDTYRKVGYSDEKIAEELGIPEKTIKKYF